MMTLTSPKYAGLRRIVAALLVLLFASLVGLRPAKAATVIIYQNNFESPLVPLSPNCALDLDAGSVNSHYGPEFQQQNTVETLLIHGPNHVYSDPSGIGGNYALGMLSTVQNDKIALTFDSGGYPFVNVALDLSPIDLAGCGGPFGTTAPVLQLTLIDSPGGAFSFGSGTILDSANATGVTSPSPHTFTWSHHVVPLTTSSAMDGRVTLVFDLLQSGYAAIDNIVITVSDTPGSVTVDADGDGVPDSSDNCPSIANPGQENFDNDAQGNACDTDDDDDGVPDASDAFPLNPNETLDNDHDGIGNNADTDDDNDSLSDTDEATLGTNPTNPDSDGDGINDGLDAFPLNPNESLDADHDGIGDNADLDDDNDGLSDVQEVAAGTDSFDTDTDDDGVNDHDDALPLDPTETLDTDGDGIGNNADTDDDNDGVPDNQDALPLDPTETVDTDGDGIGNNADTDDDDDGIVDSRDAFPLDPDETVDTDGDGIGNNADADDDNDNVPDAEDPDPLVPDTTAPVLTLVSTPFKLWPPNHQYQTISIDDFVLGVSDETDRQLNTTDVVITKVSSDEAEDAAGNGDGNTLNDIVIATDGKSVDVRAERQGSGNGRVYTLHVKVIDRSGNTATATFKVHVSKSQGNTQVVDDGPVYIVTRP